MIICHIIRPCGAGKDARGVDIVLDKTWGVDIVLDKTWGVDIVLDKTWGVDIVLDKTWGVDIVLDNDTRGVYKDTMQLTATPVFSFFYFFCSLCSQIPIVDSNTTEFYACIGVDIYV